MPIKVWATGAPAYIKLLETILKELSPILDLGFEWVNSEREADFKAYVGVPRSNAAELGFAEPRLVDSGGFAGWSTDDGEVTSGYIVVWHNVDSPGGGVMKH